MGAVASRPAAGGRLIAVDEGKRLRSGKSSKKYVPRFERKRAAAALGRCSSDLAAGKQNKEGQITGGKKPFYLSTAQVTASAVKIRSRFDHYVSFSSPKMVMALASLTIGLLVLIELAALVYLAFSIYSTSAKIERVKEKMKEIPGGKKKKKKGSRTKNSRAKSSKTSSKTKSSKSKSNKMTSERTKSKTTSKEDKLKKMKKNRTKCGREPLDMVTDMRKVEPFPMPEATHPRIRVERMEDPETLVDCADQVTLFIKKYKDNIDKLPVSCDVSPGFLAHRLPSHPPEKRDKFADVLSDFADLILPGLIHWQHPRFLAPQMAGPCIPDSMAEIMLSQMSTIGFSWDSSPSCNELDVVMTNWAGRALGIPEDFLFKGNTEFSPGGGTITESVADSHVCVVMSSRWTTTNRLMIEDGHVDKDGLGYLVDPKTAENFSLHHSYYQKLVVYGNEASHPSLEKVCRLTMLQCRKIVSLPKNDYGMSAEQLEEQMREDVEMGLVPCCVLVTLGIKGLLTDDHLEEIAFVAKKYKCWLHVDASETGGFWIEPSLRPDANHLALADSILAHLRFQSVNVMILWNKNQKDYKMGYYINASYLRGSRRHQFDSRDWTMHLSRRVRSLKIFFSNTMLGLEHMKNHVRKLCLLAEQLKLMLNAHPNIQLFGKQRNNTFSFQYAEPGMSDKDIFKYTKRLGKFLNQSKKIVLKIVETAGTVLLTVAINYDYSTDDTVKDVGSVLLNLIDEFSAKKDQHDLLKFPATPVKVPSLLAVTPLPARS